jgi:hypothetical protein
MESKGKTPEHNANEQGYKVTGDGNVPNDISAAGNRSFQENPHAVHAKSSEDIPGTEFNTGDKAFHDSSKEDFVKTVSSVHHAESESESESGLHVDLSYKTPDGDR